MSGPPPIPASCAHRPTTGGLVVPVVNLQLADGGADFRSRHQATLGTCWHRALCQVCGNPVGTRAILLGGPDNLRSGWFDEAPICPPCAHYAAKACPMLAGRQARFADRDPVSGGPRGKTCPDPGCDCGGFTSHGGGGQGGAPAHPWYAVFIDPAGYVVTVQDEKIRCSDRVCDELHTRTVVTGGQLTAPPLKIYLVSEPGAWQRADLATITGTADE
jgi:hypothetical protein